MCYYLVVVSFWQSGTVRSVSRGKAPLKTDLSVLNAVYRRQAELPEDPKNKGNNYCTAIATLAAAMGLRVEEGPVN